MKCHEFKSLIKEPQDNEKELEAHLAECPECCQWLNNEITTPPDGLTPTEWQRATSRCFPETKELVKAAEPESFWKYYVNGLKYGAVFGLSIVTGFAILNLKEETLTTYDLSKPQELSFAEPFADSLPDFLAKDKFPVTFLSDEDSKLIRLVEKAQIFYFMEEYKE